jgi:hypothetical protein
MFSGNRLIWNIIIHCHIVGETDCFEIKSIEARTKGEIRENNKNVDKKDNHGRRFWTFISQLMGRNSVILLRVSKVLSARPSDNSTMEFKILWC